MWGNDNVWTQSLPSIPAHKKTYIHVLSLRQEPDNCRLVLDLAFIKPAKGETELLDERDLQPMGNKQVSFIKLLFFKQASN